MDLTSYKEQLVGKELDTLPHNVWRNIRVMRKDGENFFGTADFQPLRVNVEVTEGIITDVISVG